MLTKIKLLRYANILALFVWFAASISGFAQSAKIAVIGDPSLGALVDVTTAQLSSVPDLGVLERSDLDKVGHEQALKEIVGSNDLSSVQFLPADGLIVLRAVKQGGKTGIFARLVAVQPGIVLRETALSDGADITAQANQIVKEFAPYWPKLAQIQRGKTSALSLLGLRFELDAPESREMERKINVLLASRLSAEPDTVVLERWRLNDAVFEKSLQAQHSSPFWTGSSLIDGSMTWQNNVIAVNLRVRPPSGPEVSIQDKDSADHLPALIERLAAKIQSRPITAGTWQPAAEANHYAELGKWCLDNRLTEQGAEAIESALALGDDSPTTHRLQVRAYGSLTYTDEFLDATSSYIPEAPVVTPESIVDRMKWAMNATDSALHYWKAHPDFAGQPGAADDPVTVCLPVLNNCLRLIRLAYQTGYAWGHVDETADLRHSVESLISQMEPVLAKRAGEQHDDFIKLQVRYAPFWHESPETTVAYYRDLLSRTTDGMTIRTVFFESRYFPMHPPVLLPEAVEQAADPGNSMIPGDWYSAAPRLISWENRSPDELLAVWKNFMKELSASPDAVLRADELKCELGPERFEEREYDEAKNARLLTFLEQNRDSLTGIRGDEILNGIDWTYSEILMSTNKANFENLRAFGLDLLNARVALPSEWIKRMPTLYYELPPDAARAVLTRLDAYRQWYQTQTPQDPELVAALERARRPLDALANVAPQEKDANFVTVNRRWPMQGFGADLMRTSIFSPSFIVAENKAWFVMFGGKLIHCIDPANFQNDAVFTIPPEMINDVAHSPGGVSLGVTPQFLVVCIYGKVLLCSRTDSTWRKLDLPPSDYKPCWINQQLYLIYDVEKDMIDAAAKDESPATAISGLIRVSLPDGGIENLVSTRRIPPQSPLDGKPLGFPIGLWDSPAGLMLAVHADSPLFQIFGASPGKNDWALVSSDALKCDVKAGTGGQLIGKGFEEHGFVQLVLMNGKDSEVLLSNPKRALDGSGSTARWDLPEDVQAIPPDVLWQAGAVMRGDDLCFYRNVMKATSDGFQACLYYFSKGQKNGLRIPLKFLPPANEIPALVRNAPTVLNFQSVQATDYGLVIDQAMGGFWVIPWSDIDAFRGHAGSTSVAAATPTPSEVPAAPAPPPVMAAPVAIAPAPVIAPPIVAPPVPVMASPVTIAPAPVIAPPVLVYVPLPQPVQAKVVPPVTPPVPAPAPQPVLTPPPAPSIRTDDRD